MTYVLALKDSVMERAKGKGQHHSSENWYLKDGTHSNSYS